MFDLQEISAVTGGRCLNTTGDVTVTGVSIDSRTIQPGELYVAIKGHRLDGHRFIQEVYEKGAAAALVCRRDLKRLPDLPVIYVEDTVRGLGRLARQYRDRFKIPVLAITGSNGKTTAKEMIRAVLAKRLSVLATDGTKNNHIGVPLTLFRLNAKTAAAVIELGTNQPGDIAWLTFVANPDLAVLMNIGESHLERLKSPAYVFKEKARLVQAMKPQGTVVLNADDRFLKKLPGRFPARRYQTFGIDSAADCRGHDVRLDPLSLRLRFRVGREDFSLATVGQENVYNALAAITCGRIFRIPYPDIRSALEDFSFPPGRQNLLKVRKYWLIDDTYNANPLSMRSAIRALADFPAKGRKVLVCGDMLDLGTRSREQHRRMGDLAGRSRIAVILGMGKMTRELVGRSRRAGAGQAVHCRTRGELHRRLRQLLKPGDAVLVKGSRATAMEKTVGYLARILKER